jgi:uncharacterized repeat protein (TIGR01451 family)
MSRSPLVSKLWSAAIAGALASAAIITIGCSQEEQPQAYSSRDPGSAQASSIAKAQHSGQSDVSMAFPTGNRDTSDLLVEQIGPSEVRVGQPYSYQLRVTNLKNQPLTGVTLRQRLPGDFKLASSDAASAPEGNDGQAKINIGDLGPRESKTIQMSGTPSKPGTLDTCVSARYNPPTLCSHIAVVAPAIEAIAEGPSQADVCQNLAYHYKVTNTGTGTAHNLILQENLPEGLQSANGQRTISENIGDLAQGQSKDVNIQLRANQPGRFATQAIVRSDAGQVETRQISTSVLAPKLAVTVSGPKQEYLGQPLSYQVSVKNNGDAPAAQARVRLGATPGHVQFVSAQGANGTQLSSEQPGGGQDIGTIPPGETRTITVNFNSQQGGPMAVDATAEAQCAQPVTTSVNTNIMTLTASALVVTHNPDPVLIGSNVTYDIVVQNKGTAPDHDLRVTAKLPEGEQYVRATGQSEATNDGQNITFGPIATLEPKQSVTWHVVAKALRAGDVEFQATMLSKSTPKAAVKIEPTKLYGVQGGTETHTKEAPAPAPINSPAPPPAGQQTPDLNK